MKKLTIVLVSALVVLFTTEAKAQLTFTVNPGLNYNGANFGYKAGNFLPYIGAQYFGGSSKVSYEGTQWNYTTSVMESYSDEYKFSGNVIIPTIGTRYYFLNRSNLHAFANANVTKPIVTAKYINNGEEDEDLKEYISNISIWAGELGFGAEYNFAPQFSISGEFGFRWVRVNYDEDSENEVYNPMTGLYETHDYQIKSTTFFSPTYSRISLNFYFGAGKVQKQTKSDD